MYKNLYRLNGIVHNFIIGASICNDIHSLECLSISQLLPLIFIAVKNNQSFIINIYLQSLVRCNCMLIFLYAVVSQKLSTK